MNRIFTLLSSFFFALMLINQSYAEQAHFSNLDKTKRQFEFFNSTLSAEQEVTQTITGVESDLRGNVKAIFNPGFRKLRIRVRLSSIENVVAMHFSLWSSWRKRSIGTWTYCARPIVLKWQCFNRHTDKLRCTR